MQFARSLAAIVLLAACALAQTPPGDEPSKLSLDNTARLVGVLPETAMLEKLSQGTAAHTDAAETSAARWKILWLHQHVSEQVLAASLQVDATIAQIDNEIARTNEVRGYLSDRRDHAVTRANLLSALVGGGLGATSSGLQLSSTLDKPAAAVGIGAGALSSGLAITGIRAQHGGTAVFNFDSNMLAEFFGKPVLPDSHYAPTVWTFLNQVAPTDPGSLTRKQRLIQTWVEVKRIDSNTTSAPKINRLTSQPSDDLKLTIDDLEDRAAMLQDIRAKISFLKRDLGRLLASLPAVGSVPPEAMDTPPVSKP